MNGLPQNDQLLGLDPVIMIFGGTALMSLLFLFVAAGSYWRRIDPHRLFIVALVGALPLLSATAVSQAAKSVLAVNLCAADFVIPFAIAFLLLRRLYRADSLDLSLWWAFVLFFVWILVSMYIGINRYRLDPLAFSNFVTIAKFWALLAYFYVMLNLIRDLGDFRAFIYTWLWSEAAVALLGIGGSLLYVFFHIVTPFSAEFRGHGTFGNPNMFAGHMLVGFFLAFIYRILDGKRWLFVGFILVHFSAIVTSASKGGLVAFTLGFCVFIVLIPRHRLKLLAAGSAFAMLLVGSYFVSDTTKVYVDRILQLADPDANTYQARFTLWGEALGTWSDNFVFGVGRGNFQLEEQEESQLGGSKMAKLGYEGFSKQQSEIHSTFISLLCETGTIGFIIFIGIMALFILRLLQCLLFLDSTSPSYQIVVALLAAVLGMLGQGAVANVEEARGLWVLLGVVYASSGMILRGDPRWFRGQLPAQTADTV
jgi:O-antigen ligase